MSKRFLRRPKVEDRTGYSKSTLYSLIAQGKFPAPIKLSPRISVWVEDDVDSWIRERIEESRR